MDASIQEDEIHEFDESSWVYLSLQHSKHEAHDLQQGVIAALEESGWPAVTWASLQGEEAPTSRFFEGMGHAVEHADVVVVLMSGSSAFVDAELAFAYRHRRPVVALQIGDAEPCASDVRAMLLHYERFRMVECRDATECISGLRGLLADPSFEEMVDEATGEGSHA